MPELFLPDEDVPALEEAYSAADADGIWTLKSGADAERVGMTLCEARYSKVMRDGGIVEQCDRSELLAKGGSYAQLYNARFEQAV